jgi:hypothetical protein
MGLFEDLGRDLKPEFASTTITDIYRLKLQVLAESIDLTINHWLDVLTTEQLNRVVERLKKSVFDTFHNSTIINIVKHGEEWLFYFDTNHKLKLRDIETADVLNIMAVIEKVMKLKNTLKP